MRIFCFSCLGEVSFAENVVADVLTSLGRPLKDVAYTVCYFRRQRMGDGRWERLGAGGWKTGGKEGVAGGPLREIIHLHTPV